METRLTVSGIVLSGGMSRRLGRTKAIEQVGGEPLVTRVIGRLSNVTDEIVVVVADYDQASALPLPDSTRVAVDSYPNSGSLGGIFAGLEKAEGGWGIVMACDMPFINLDLVEEMLDRRNGFDVVVPILNGRPEPTHAVYSKTCLPYIERRLQANDLKIARFFEDVKVRYLPQDVIEKIDPKHLSFFNVNTQEELDLALSLVDRGY